MMKGYVSLENCEEDSGNVEGGLEVKKTSSWFSKLKIIGEKCVPDMAQPTRLQSIKEDTGKSRWKITSGIGRIYYKRLESERYLNPGEVANREQPIAMEGQLEELDEFTARKALELAVGSQLQARTKKNLYWQKTLLLKT
jgi:hypothetical protein